MVCRLLYISQNSWLRLFRVLSQSRQEIILNYINPIIKYLKTLNPERTISRGLFFIFSGRIYVFLHDYQAPEGAIL